VASRLRGTSPGHSWRSRVGYKEGAPLKGTQPGTAPGTQGSTEAAQQAIQLPPLSFPRDGPPQFHSGLTATMICNMRLSGGGNLSPITPKSGYRFGPTSRNLAKVVAIGQPPTDPIAACWENQQDFS